METKSTYIVRILGHFCSICIVLVPFKMFDLSSFFKCYFLVGEKVKDFQWFSLLLVGRPVFWVTQCSNKKNMCKSTSKTKTSFKKNSSPRMPLRHSSIRRKYKIRWLSLCGKHKLGLFFNFSPLCGWFPWSKMIHDQGPRNSF